MINLTDAQVKVLTAIAIKMKFRVITVQHGKLVLKSKSPTSSETFHWNPYVDNSDALVVAMAFQVWTSQDQSRIQVSLFDTMVEHKFRCAKEASSVERRLQAWRNLVVKAAFAAANKKER